MNEKEYLEYLRQENTIAGDSDLHKQMQGLSEAAMCLTAQLNQSYHEPEERRRIFFRNYR